MTELVQIDINNYDINKFEIPIESVQKRSFKDAKTGKDTNYFTGTLMYDKKLPYICLCTATYGIGKANDKDQDAAKGGTGDAAPPMIAGLVQLPSASTPKAEGENTKEKIKWQISHKLTEKPAPKDWTPTETRMINFLDDDLRTIIATVIAKNVDILQKIGSNVIADTQQQFQQENQPGRFADQDAMMARFSEIMRNNVKSKVSRKVWRKKKEQKEGEKIDLMNPTSQYDESKNPGFFPGIISYVSKKTGLEEVSTKYYQWVEGLPESEWAGVSHADAINKGWYYMENAIRLSDMYFGSSIAPQPKVIEAVFKTPIESNTGHKGRLIKAGPEVKRDARLISRSVIQPAGSGVTQTPVVHPGQVQTFQAPPPSSPSQPRLPQFDPSQLQNVTQAPFQQQPQYQNVPIQYQGGPAIVGQAQPNQQLQAQAVHVDQQQAAAVFDPSVLNGIAGLPIPSIASNYGNQ